MKEKLECKLTFIQNLHINRDNDLQLVSKLTHKLTFTQNLHVNWNNDLSLEDFM